MKNKEKFMKKNKIKLMNGIKIEQQNEDLNDILIRNILEHMLIKLLKQLLTLIKILKLKMKD